MSFLRNLRTIDSLKIYGFRVFFIGMSGTWAVFSLQAIAQALLLYRLTGSAALLGILALTNAIPSLVLSLYGGVLADHFAKKYIILITQGIATFSIIIVAVALSTGYLSPQHSGSWWIIMAAAVIQNSATAIMMPARQAIMLELVGRERIMNAIAINTVGFSLFQFIIPMVGGILIDAIDFTAIYYIMGGLYLWAFIFTIFIPVTRPTKPLISQNAISNIIDGLKYTLRNPTILFIVAFSLVGMILSSPQMTLMAIFADNILKVGATGMGLLQSISGVSALVISLVLATLISKQRGLMLIASGLVSGLALIVFAFSHSMLLSCLIMAVWGFAGTVNMVVTTTLIQAYTDEAYLGRVLSMQLLGNGFAGFGGFISGIMVQYIGVQWAVGGFAIIYALLAVLSLIALPKVRQLA